MDAPHRGHAKRIRQIRDGRDAGWLYVASCTGCSWISSDAVTLDYARTAAARHEREHTPGYQPPVEQVDPEHGIFDVVRLGATWDLLMRCHCGRQWSGREALVKATAADHLSITPDQLDALLWPATPATPDQLDEQPPVPAGWGSEYP